MKVRLHSIRHDQAGFEELIALNAKADKAAFDKIEIDMMPSIWFDADMCAALGAILYRLSAEMNSIALTNISPKVTNILCRNAFLSHYGRERLPDNWGSTIPYQRFEVKDDRYFGQYIESELIRRAEMPVMSHALQKKFRESVFEIFSNAVIHSQTALGIFSCGQFFPKKHRLVFTVADLGIGIRQNVKRSTGIDMASDQAIVWATEGTNTTKKGPIPGGLGLKLLREFVTLNGGVLRIVSDAGYWELSRGQPRTHVFGFPFPGTVVNIEISTSDQHTYALASELSESDIF